MNTKECIHQKALKESGITSPENYTCRVCEPSNTKREDGLETRGLTENEEALAIIKQMKDNYKGSNPPII